MREGLFAIGFNDVSKIRKILEDRDLCARTLNEDMASYLYRVVIHFQNLDDLSLKCQTLMRHLDKTSRVQSYIDVKNGLFFIKSVIEPKSHVAFVYPGQGTQHVRMLDQYLTNPTFLRTFEEMMGDLPSNYKEVYQGQSETNLIHRTDYSQPLLACVEWSLTRWLDELGVTPNYCAGHSFGELTALARSGCYEGKELMRLALERGKIMHKASLEGEGSMIAVIDPKSNSWKGIDEAVKGLNTNVELANINSNQQLVYSGPKKSVLKLKKQCEESGLKASVLQTSAAFHSRFMEDSSGSFYKLLADSRASYKVPECRVFSNYKCHEYKTAEDVPNYLSRQITSKVDWLDVMLEMFKSGVRVFIEVGPKSTLTRLLEQTLPKDECLFVALDSSADWLNTSLYLWSLGLTSKKIGVPFSQSDKLFGLSVENDVVSSFLKAQERLMKETEKINNTLQREQLKNKIIQDAEEVIKTYFGSNFENQHPKTSEEGNLVERSETHTSTPHPSKECSITNFLKQEVSELTGFSLREISEEADFDDDLALDSITKMDFFSSVVEKMGAKAPETSDLVSLRTIKEVAEYLEAQNVETSSTSVEKSSETNNQTKKISHRRKEQASFESALHESIQTFRNIPSDEITSNSHFEKDLDLNIFEREEIFNLLWSSYPYMQIAGRSMLNIETVGELVELEKALDRRASVRTEEPVKRFEWKKVLLNRNPMAMGKFQAPVLLLPFYITSDLTEIENYLVTQVDVDRYDLTSREKVSKLESIAAKTASQKGLDILFLMSPILQIDEYGEEALDNHIEMIYKLSRKLIDVQKSIPNIELKILMNSCDDAFFKGLVGLFRSLCREIDIRVTIVDLAWEKISAPELPWDILWTSKKIKTSCEYVLEEAGQFYHEELDSSHDDEVSRDEKKVAFKPGEPVLVLGGARGICAEVSKYLAAEHQVHVVALGRTEVHLDSDQCEKSKEIMNTERSVRERGGLFTYISVDACNFNSLKNQLGEFCSKHGEFKAIIHGIGYTDDALLKDKDHQRFSQVVKNKVLSAINTFKHFKNSPDLKFVCFFSSLSSWTGAPGQTDYSFANEFLNELALQWKKRRDDLPVSSLLWSVWGESGLASQQLLFQMNKLKLGTITNKEGVRLFRNELERYGLQSTKVLFTPVSTLKYSEKAGVKSDE